MDNPNSPLDTLRQLKEMLDSGALTPTEFEALKQRLVFSSATAPSSPEATAPATPPVPITPSVPVIPSAAPPVPPPAEPTPAIPFFEAADADAQSDTAALIPPALAFYSPTLEPLPLPEPIPGWTAELPESETLSARNPLALILSIGGVLVFLAVVLYLSLNRPPSEHISSTSQTAADSLAATIETGPQAAPLPQTEAVPETIRVAPAHPAPAIQPRPTPAVRDSVAAPSPTLSADSTRSQ